MTETHDEGWGATVRGGRRRGRRSVRVVLVIVVLVVLAAAATGVGAAVYASAQMQHVEVGGLDGASRPLHVLVVGSDSRAGLTPEQQRELATGDTAGERADTIFLMTVSGRRAAVLAFPRDLYVERCDGSTGRINGAFAIGGADCLVRTVRDLSDIPIDHYLAVHFLGFRHIVDAVGGVDLCLDQPIADPFAGIDLPAGCQRLDGRQALGYVRVRKIDSDLQRIERQQQFLKALAQEVISPSVALNPLRLYETAGRVGNALTGDQGLGTVALVRLGFGMLGVASGRSVTHTVPATPANVGGGAVLRVNEDEAEQLFERFRDGSVLAEAAGGAQVDPADVEVRVLNGAGITGLAARTADRLRSEGFRVVSVADASQQVDRTVVNHPRGRRTQAEAVARALDGRGELREDPTVETVTIVLGPDAA
ncbi:MAG: LCP family protein [Actinobacteria bacterium]|nr:LCP family protein [Actinomycetota bacterium]